jgi:hypothetical protein
MTLRATGPYGSLALTILQALGLSAAACGGDVIVEMPEEGGGGATATGPGPGPVTGTSVVTSTATGGFSCPVTVPAGSKLDYACVVPAAPPGGPEVCPDRSAPVVMEWMWNAYPGDCDCQPTWQPYQVPCGPDPTAPPGQCCYYVMLGENTCCVGRPFTVRGDKRVAPPTARADWCPSLAPALAGLDPEERSALGRAWLADALEEHASVASFARLALQLLAQGAPPELLRLTQKAMADEIKHAELCFALAGAYAGEALGPGALDVGGALGGADSPVALALATLEEGCVGETVSAMCAEEAALRCEDPAVRRVLEVIARDERAHAVLAWRVLAWLVGRGGEDVADVVGTAARALARRADEQAPATRRDPHLAALASPPEAAPAVARRGRLSAAERTSVASRAMREVVLPCVRALLGGGPGVAARLSTETRSAA